MKQIDLKEYVRFYIGCKVWDTFNDCEVELTPMAYAGYMNHWTKPDSCQIKPILREFSDMTDTEKAHLAIMMYCSSEEEYTEQMDSKARERLRKQAYVNITDNFGSAQLSSFKNGFRIFKYLIEREFDLFDLIGNLLAVNRADLKIQSNGK